MVPIWLILSSIESHAFFVICLLDVFCVCNQQVITNQFNFTFFVEFGPTVPIILCKRILNQCDRVLFQKWMVQLSELCWGPVIWSTALESEVVVPIPEKLTWRRIDCKLNPVTISTVCNSLDENIKSFIGLGNWRSKSSLIADAGRLLLLVLAWALGLNAFLEVKTFTCSTKFLDNDFLKLLVDFAAHTDSFSNRSGTNRSNHGLLKCHRIARMHTSVEDIEEWNGHHVRLFRPWFSAKELVQWYILGKVSSVPQKKKCANGSSILAYQGRCPCSGASHANPQNSIGSQVTFILGTVQVIQKLVDLFLIRFYLEPTVDQSRRNNLLYFLYCCFDTLPAINRRFSIPQLDSFTGTGRGSRGSKSAECAW